VLRRVNPDRGIARFYPLMIDRNLFDSIQLARNWGRVGASSQELVRSNL
jgi:predicted DNA-binding WGR domain protein